jgi:GntR family transcriptional regulator, transcriptional repressor for pyruvate dehydrogenase complex
MKSSLVPRAVLTDVVFESRRPVTHAVIEEITLWITSGKYKPGEHLPSEGDLAKFFTVSKPSIRESLRQLEAFGVLEISHGRPPTVKTVSSVPLVSFFHLAVTNESDSLREAVELRRGLEIQSVLLASERATEGDICLLQKHIEMLDTVKADKEAWIKPHVAFHVALVSASHNRFFAFLQDALGETIERTDRQIIEANSQRDPVVTFKRHLAIFDAVKNHDPIAARKAVESHFNAVDVVLSAQLADV